jgi:mRNA interferase MazF
VILEPGHDPIGRRSVVNLNSVEPVSIALLVERMATVGGSRLRESCSALDGASQP